MCDCNRRGFIWGTTGVAAASLLATNAFAMQATDRPAASGPKVYTCPPCGCPNDGKEFPAPGACSVCAMPLMEKAPAPAQPEGAEPTQKAAPKAAPVERPAP